MSRKKWEELKPPISKPVLSVIKQFGFPMMTPVQTATIPILMAHKDVSVEAVTGSGKTLAFLVPLLEILQKRHIENPWGPKEVGALIISPTRELSIQISEVLNQFLSHKNLKHLRQLLLIGGNSIEHDVSYLKKENLQILVSTPGRLEDILKRKDDVNLAARVKSLEFLVLDEADRLLDLGFKTTINNILSFLPRQRRTGLFSATQTTEVTDLIRAGLRNPVVISVKEKSTINTPVRLQNFYKIVQPEEKFIKLLEFLKSPEVSSKKVMIFFPTCACVEYWLNVMPSFIKNRKLIGIHGKMKNKRKKIVEEFRNDHKSILLCTDVLARGLDVPNVDWVIQWEPPSNAASFVHRVGRTARQESDGNALVFLLPNEDAYVIFLKINQKVQLNDLTEVFFNDEDPQAVLNKLHKLQVSDRGLFDKAIRAFVSDIQAYRKHECNAILRIKDIDLCKVATCYGLLQMPRMPELKNYSMEGFIGPNFEFEISKIPYKNVQKEHLYQEKLKTYNETGVWPGKKKFKKHSEPWERTKMAKLDAKRKKSLRKQKLQKKKKIDTENGTLSCTKKRKSKFTQEDLDELATDLRLFKRLKANKISEEDFNGQMGIDDE